RAGTYTSSITIADYGGASAQAVGTAAVADAPLTVTAVPLSATEGAAFSGVVAQFTDPDHGAGAAGYTATIAWGDGSSSPGAVAFDTSLGAFTVAGAHTYARAGSYSASIAVADYGGATAQVVDAVTVADAPLTVTAVPLSATEGAAFSGVVAQFTDPDPGAVASDYTATIAWGDGSSSPGAVAFDTSLGAFTVAGAHTYARAGSYSASIAVADYGGATAQVVDAVTVADAPL